jgi:hypothetical protein
MDAGHTVGTVAIPPTTPQRLCVGKEWHRFPSHFLLPLSVRVAFLKTDFAGLLPKYYEAPPPEGTRLIPAGMNDLNKEDPSRYVRRGAATEYPNAGHSRSGRRPGGGGFV